MAKLFPGRYTAHIEGPFVVFLIGMRINYFWMVWKWLPVAMAMGPLIKTLEKAPAKGYLQGESYFNARGAVFIQYWRSLEDLEKFARSPKEPHLQAWQNFNRRVSVNGTVGIWHETYQVAEGRYESIYNNMPVFGLAKAGSHLPADAVYEKTRHRLS